MFHHHFNNFVFNIINFRQYFTAHVFGKLQDNDPQGRISILNLFNYIMRKTWLNQTLVSLSLYDPTGFGFLREEV